jgi:preprotein translocase subunit SecG
MNTLYSILVAIDVLLAIGIIGLILIQHGKGADVGAAFGSGASGTVFGSQGSASFLTRLTAILATLFFVNSLGLAYLASNRPAAESVIDSVEQTSTTTDATSIEVANDIPEDVPSSDVPDEEGTMQDMSSEEMGESDVPDMPAESEVKTDAVANDSLNEIQDSMEAIKEDVESTLDKESPNDVPE